jgi:hypothetical protein
MSRLRVALRLSSLIGRALAELFRGCAAGRAVPVQVLQILDLLPQLLKQLVGAAQPFFVVVPYDGHK